MSASLVLILGAGASVPYGFPTGGALRHWICDLWACRHLVKKLDGITTNDQDRRSINVFRTFAQLGIDVHRATAIGKMLAESKLPSIDRLVFHQSDEIARDARIVIATLLLDCEHNDALNDSRVGGDWFVSLWSSLTAGRKSIDEVPTGRLAVFTFNYDRSLERLLLTACQSTYGVNDDAAATFVSKFQIEHFYGVNTPLRELDRSGVMFDCDRSNLYAAVESAEKEIWLIDDHRKRQAKVFSNARKAMEEAQVVTFLGYGFDEVNDANLGVANWLKEFADYSAARREQFANAPRITYLPGGEEKIDPSFKLLPARTTPKFQGTTLGMYDREVDAAIRRMGLRRGNAVGQISTLPKDSFQALREWGTFDLLRS